ncbi:MAG: hypothetical protein SAL70_37960 [Scytonema sp. PMC 1070.18]|nr:hypothetical protein [Scytonema sp. PMC 1070.18]
MQSGRSRFVQTVLVYKLPNLSPEEIEAMPRLVGSAGLETRFLTRFPV